MIVSKKCVEQPLYQKEWLGISFDMLSIKPDFKNLATSEFYDAFYEKFLDKYPRFTDLPGDWLRAQEITAEYISDLLPKSSRVLSYGCGSGYVESLIAKNRPDLSLTAFDFSEVASKLIENDGSINLVTALDTDLIFDVIYVNHVLYAIDFQGCIELLSEMRKNLLEDGGILILVNHSIIPDENGVKINFYWRFKSIIKNFLKPIYRTLRYSVSSHRWQFWGWERNNACYQTILKKSNFELLAAKGFNQHSYLVAKKS